MSQVDEEKVWGLIAWLVSIIGAVVSLVFKSNSKYVRYWAYLSISFFVVMVVGQMVVWVISLILGFIPFVGWVLSSIISGLYLLVVLVVWVFGIVKSLSMEYWRPPLIYDLARMMGIEKI
jgi:uncharacterized membrane protein